MNQDLHPARSSPERLRGPRAGRAGRWTYLPFRVIVTAAALLLFDQAVFAGQFLAGTFGSLQTHRENATVAGIVTLGAAIAAVPVRWPGKGPIWPIFACLGLFGVIALQIALGFARELAVHVPLGVSIILLTTLLAIRAWRPFPPSASPPGGQGLLEDAPVVAGESGA
jgi:hypothetical protein